MAQRLTLDDLAAIDRDFLTCDQVAHVLGAHPDTIRGQAQERPGLLGFPVCCVGRRVKIPKVPFLRFMGYEN